MVIIIVTRRNHQVREIRQLNVKSQKTVYVSFFFEKVIFVRRLWSQWPMLDLLLNYY